MNDTLLQRAINGEPLEMEQALYLYNNIPLAELADAADRLRRAKVDDPEVVTWQIDRNVNITNVCISGCKFCNFHCKPHQRDRHYITTIEEYCSKIETMLDLGGDQLLLQGGLHPELDIHFYEELFRELKRLYPQVRLHALGAPEVAHIARISSLGHRETLERLVAAGLDSLPGAGAEILTDRVRKAISPAKPTVQEWLDVMHQAHLMNLPTSATMMYGHIETIEERIEHLLKIRDLQSRVPEGNWGFVAFIPWIFRSTGTRLEAEGVKGAFSANEYLRIIAISRLVLNNIHNIQASWLTVGKQTAQVALHSGANDMGSIMIEENVVSSAGAHNSFDAEGIQAAIREAGFRPQLRDQLYRPRTYQTRQ
ncbi:MAG: CofH family radical SAM protein [Rikenellaceae bacterium]|nr:CofH family radical SAM protein [Rikenellaceae bacterium]